MELSAARKRENKLHNICYQLIYIIKHAYNVSAANLIKLCNNDGKPDMLMRDVNTHMQLVVYLLQIDPEQR